MSRPRFELMPLKCDFLLMLSTTRNKITVINKIAVPRPPRPWSPRACRLNNDLNTTLNVTPSCGTQYYVRTSSSLLYRGGRYTWGKPVPFSKVVNGHTMWKESRNSRMLAILAIAHLQYPKTKKLSTKMLEIGLFSS